MECAVEYVVEYTVHTPKASCVCVLYRVFYSAFYGVSRTRFGGAFWHKFREPLGGEATLLQTFTDSVDNSDIVVQAGQNILLTEKKREIVKYDAQQTSYC